MATKPPGLVPGHPQKHDPAWKHVQILSLSGDKKQLKCIYCGKIFNGGGIHRIKEHLACQKGNASRWHRVPEEVRDAMRASLNGPSSGRKGKVKVVEESVNLSISIPINMVVLLGSQCEVDNGLQLLVDGIDPNSGMLVKRGGRGEDYREKEAGKATEGCTCSYYCSSCFSSYGF